MGTDIHAQAQVRRSTGWEWAGYGPIVDDGDWPILSNRNYHLFAILAGVRGEPTDYGHDVDVGPIAPERGWPKDIPPAPRDPEATDDWGDWGFSWATLRELDAFPWSDSDRRDCAMFLEHVLPWLRTLGRPDDVRIVFGFDS